MKFDKKRLVEIALNEANNHNSSNSDKNSGINIEKYLFPFRQLLDARDSSSSFMNIENGYDWCGSFVHFCLNSAGMKIPLDLNDDKPTFALVKTWYNWASSNKKWTNQIGDVEKGDLIIFKHESDEKRQFKHIGIIIDFNKTNFWIKSAEGNVKYINQDGKIRRRTQIVEYYNDKNIKGYIKL